MKMKGILAASALALTVSFVSSASQAQEEIRLGVLLPTSGAAAKSGQETVEAVQFAVDLINKHYDIDFPFAKGEGLPGKGGAKIKVIIEDHAGLPERGASIAERMIVEEKVHILQGCFQSSVCATATQAAERAGVPFVTGTSESPALTERGFRTLFSVTPTADDIARDFFTFLKEQGAKHSVKLNSLAVFHVNDVWGSSLAKAATASYKDYGYGAIKTVAYPTNVSDLKGEVLQLKRDNPDVILQASFDTDAIIAVRAYQALQLQPKAILAMGASFSTPEFINALGKLANYAFSHTKFHGVLLDKRRGAAQINEEYKKRTGRPLWDAPARAFTATMVIADALNRAKSLSRDDIIAALKETNIPGTDTIVPYKGVKFDARGRNELANGLITQIQDGKHYAVWPADVSEREAVFPIPAWDAR
jgi:branched-chain amino acid transport system substrate-binding protein